MILRNLRIWDGVSGQIDAGMDAIEVQQGRIVRVTSSDALDGQPGKDMGGLSLLPGLMDAHVHMCLDPGIRNPLEQVTDREMLMVGMKQRALAMLRAGITTARDLGGGNWQEMALRDAINRGEVPGPRLLCAGQPLTSVGGHCHFWGGEVDGESDIEAMIRLQVEKGVDLIKVMATGGTMTVGTHPSRAQFPEKMIEKIVAESARHHHQVAAHCHGTEGIVFAARAGVRTIEHCSWVGTEGWGRGYDEAAVSAMIENGVWVSPTINAGWQRHVGKGGFEHLLQSNYEKMKRAGVRMIASTDAGIPNVYHHELSKALPVFAHMAKLTPVEVLKSATSECAIALGLENETGR
ncbi:MAG: amidohydrolase family protein, partial [Gammaproteobacteria bacterium]|nr:amidohydrolase family protein [Gammaproteobacteria bacterium]